MKIPDIKREAALRLIDLPFDDACASSAARSRSLGGREGRGMKLTGRHLRIDSIEDLRAFMELHGTTPTEARLANEVVRLRVALEAIANEPDDDEINPYPLRDRIEIARRALAGEKATG